MQSKLSEYRAGRYTLSPEAFNTLKENGLLNRLNDVLEKAAIISHSLGNRRYHDFVIDVRGTHIYRVTNVLNTHHANDFIVWEPCPTCSEKYTNENTRCGTCGGKGEVKVLRKLTK